MPISARHPLIRYSVAVASVAVMAILRQVATGVLGDRQPFAAFIFAVLLTAWYSGLGPTILSVVLSCLAAKFFFLDPTGSLRFANPYDLVRMGLFVTLSSGIMAFSEVSRRTRGWLEREVVERRRAEEAERLQRERLETTLASVGDGVIVADARGRVVSLNPVAATITAWDANEAIGKKLSEVFHSLDPETQKTVEIEVPRERPTGHPAPSVQRMLLPRGGQVLQVEHSTAPIRDEKGALTGYVIVCRDVTTRARAEEVLRTSEARLREIADTMPQIVWQADPGGGVQYFNGRWYEYTGLSVEESLAHEGWRSVIHPDDVGTLYSVRNRAVGAGGLFEAEARVRDRGGEYHWHLIRSVPVRDASGTVTSRYGTATDIDDRRRDEEALRANEQRLRLALAAGHMVTWDWNLRTNGVTWSDNIEVVFKVSRGALGADLESFMRLVYPDDRHHVQTAIARSLEDGSGFEAEYRTVARDGSLVWILGKGRIVSEAGVPTRMIGVSMDITERKRLEHDLIRGMEDLAEADRRKNDFLAVLAHELRNPLAALSYALRLDPAAGADGPESAQALNTARRQTTLLERLVEDLMDLSRINSGKVELRREVVSLDDLVRRAVSSVESSLRDRGHTLTVNLPDEPILLDADALRIEQVLWNLLNNAVKYSGENGRITLVASREGNEAVVRVRDTGIGMTPELIGRVFDKFVQGDERPKVSAGGLGIGLSLVKTLVEMHGGQVAALSDGPGHGSEFEVRLPALAATSVTRPPAPASHVDPVPSVEPPPCRKVLVIDDNAEAARFLARILRRQFGQEVEVVNEGARALDAALRFRPDLVLLDIGMPEMDGYEVARRLRACPGLGGLRIVALTGWGQDSDRRQTKAAGFDQHVVKPIESAVLATLLGNGQASRA